MSNKNLILLSLHSTVILLPLHFAAILLHILLSLHFFNCYLAAPRPTLGHCRRDSLIHSMLISAFLKLRPEDHWEPHSEVGSLSPAERLVGFELETFPFWLQRLNPLGHSTVFTFYCHSNSHSTIILLSSHSIVILLPFYCPSIPPSCYCHSMIFTLLLSLHSIVILLSLYSAIILLPLRPTLNIQWPTAQKGNTL